MAQPILAGSVEVWNGAEVEWVNQKRWLWRTRGEVRSARAFQSCLQLRGSSDLRLNLAPHFTLLNQLHIVEGKRTGGWEESNRIMAGFELPFTGATRTYNARSLVERLWVPGGLVYDRFRERFSVRFTRLPLQPQHHSEIFLDQRGWAAYRPSLTIMIPISPRVALDAGYHFEWRPGRLGGSRQMVYTYFRIRRKGL